MATTTGTTAEDSFVANTASDDGSMDSLGLEKDDNAVDWSDSGLYNDESGDSMDTGSAPNLLDDGKTVSRTVDLCGCAFVTVIGEDGGFQIHIDASACKENHPGTDYDL